MKFRGRRHFLFIINHKTKSDNTNRSEPLSKLQEHLEKPDTGWLMGLINNLSNFHSHTLVENELMMNYFVYINTYMK